MDSDISIQDHKREASILIPVLMVPGCQVHTRLFGPLIPFVLTSQNKTCLPNFSFLLTQRVAGRAVPPGKSQVRAVPLRVSLQHNPSKIKPAAGYALLAQAVLHIKLSFDTSEEVSLCGSYGQLCVCASSLHSATDTRPQVLCAEQIGHAV